MNGFGAAASSYDDQNSINILNLYGTSTIDNVTFTEMNENGIAYRNTLADDGTRDVLTVSNSTFSNHLATTHGEDGIDYQADGTALAGLIVSSSTFTIDGDGALGIQFSSQGTANADLTVQGSNFNAASAFGSGTILTNNTANSTSLISITGNTITNTPFTGIDVLNNDTAVTRATISNNIVDGNGVGINNSVGPVELRMALLQIWGKAMDEEEFEDIFNAVDRDGLGQLSLHRFAASEYLFWPLTSICRLFVRRVLIRCFVPCWPGCAG